MWRTGVNAEDIKELRKTADLSLRETKETDRAIGRSMEALVLLLDAPLLPSSLFGDAVGAVVDRHQEAGKQVAVFQRFLPRRSLAQGLLGESSPCHVPAHHIGKPRKCHCPCPPPRRGQGGKHSSRSEASKPKLYLQTVLQAKMSSAKRP